MEKMRLPELLAPAGSLDALFAAIDAGADAVYLGAKGFNARMNAANFSDEELATGIARAHRFGVKVYATLNTLVHDRELPAFLETARALRDAGVDAVIVADLGAIAALSHELPSLPIHVSTQASVHSLDGALAMAALGATRVVPARELSLSNIRTLTTHAPLEIEVFVHGALCVSYSGQCLFSSLVGGRSGNRGECAQPCRLPYNGGKYPLSLRDLSLASHIPALIDAGVASLKIEGRMKSAAYVHGVCSVYRRLLDGRRAATPEEIAYLSDLFSRDGFTDGYFTGRIQKGMIGTRTDAAKEKTRTLPPPPPFSRRIPLSATLSLTAGAPARLTLTAPDGRVGEALGDVPDAAKSLPLSRESLFARISKLGGTDYSLADENFTVNLDDGLFLTPASINALRRAAVEALDAAPCNTKIRRGVEGAAPYGKARGVEGAAPYGEARGVEGAAPYGETREGGPLPYGETRGVEGAAPYGETREDRPLPYGETRGVEGAACETGEDAAGASPRPTTIQEDVTAGASPRPAIHEDMTAGASPRPTVKEDAVAAPALSPAEIAVCYTAEQARAARDAGISLVFLPLEEYDTESGGDFGVALPPVIQDSEHTGVYERLARVRAAGATVALATNIAQVAPLREMGFTVVGDLRLNTYNRVGAALLREMGVSLIIPSPELSLPQLRDLGAGVATVYGRLPLMLTERCFIKENFGCDKCGKSAFTDRRGARFPILREAGHRNVIFNSLPTYMGDRRDALSRAGITTAHFLFTVESAGRVREVIRAWRAGEPLSEGVRRIGRN